MAQPDPKPETHPPWLQLVIEARRASTSLIGITTLDARATISQVTAALLVDKDKDAPVLEWDITRGALGTTPSGEAALQSILPKDAPDALTMTGALPEFLALAVRLPLRSMVFFHNIQMYLDNPGVRQGLWNLRDAWLPKKGMAILLGPEILLPPELVNDVLLFEEPAPDDAAITTVAKRRLVTSTHPADPELVRQVTAAMRGVGSEFLVDQCLAMSVRKVQGQPATVRMDDLWARKRQAINAVQGLSVWEKPVVELAGLERPKAFFINAATNSPVEPPAAFVFIDEVEKSLGGAGTVSNAADSSGVSQYQLRTLLQITEDWESNSALFLGIGGVAKTAFVRWLAKKLGIMLIDMDLGAFKGQYVGQSEQQLRLGVRTLKGISGGRPGGLWFFFVCNKLEVLPPEFRSRMDAGMWFFDLPQGPQERGPIWEIQRAAFNIPKEYEVPHDRGWTGREIRNCCRIAHRSRISLVEAATYIVPLVVSESGPDGAIERLHRLADQRFLNVSAPGHYDHKTACPNAPGSTVGLGAASGGRIIDEEPA